MCGFDIGWSPFIFASKIYWLYIRRVAAEEHEKYTALNNMHLVLLSSDFHYR